MENEQCIDFDTEMVFSLCLYYQQNKKMGLLLNHHPALKRAEAGHDVDGDTSFTSVTWQKYNPVTVSFCFHTRTLFFQQLAVLTYFRLYSIPAAPEFMVLQGKRGSSGEHLEEKCRNEEKKN